jgi:hypothetical protein
MSCSPSRERCSRACTSGSGWLFRKGTGGGGIPPLFGVVFTPIGIYQLARGDPNTESLGWIFTLIGVLMAIVGAVALIALLPERKKPASGDGEGAPPWQPASTNVLQASRGGPRPCGSLRREGEGCVSSMPETTALSTCRSTGPVSSSSVSRSPRPISRRCNRSGIRRTIGFGWPRFVPRGLSPWPPSTGPEPRCPCRSRPRQASGHQAGTFLLKLSMIARR